MELTNTTTNRDLYLFLKKSNKKLDDFGFLLNELHRSGLMKHKSKELKNMFINFTKVLKKEMEKIKLYGGKVFSF